MEKQGKRDNLLFGEWHKRIAMQRENIRFPEAWRVVPDGAGNQTLDKILYFV